MNNLEQPKHFLLAKVCLLLLALWIFIVLLGNIITVWANNPLKENLDIRVIEKRKYLEESTQDNKLVDWQNPDTYDAIYDTNENQIAQRH
ncbi:hypothetical protein, partial [Rice orange leaf phytoplasma]|uniref:hypothetical protein n=1 Tax=Rice orange leaf phytoplasma TaxID=146897 RepID=UPI000AFE12A5